MKRVLLLVLLLSAGLNIGLGMALHRARGDQREASSRPWMDHGPGMRPGEAPPGESGGHPGPGGGRARLEQMRKRLGPEADRLRREAHAARESLRVALSRPAIDEAEVRARMREMSAAQARLDSTVVETMVRELGEMTPEQRAETLRLMPWERGRHRRH